MKNSLNNEPIHIHTETLTFSHTIFAFFFSAGDAATRVVRARRRQHQRYGVLLFRPREGNTGRDHSRYRPPRRRGRVERSVRPHCRRHRGRGARGGQADAEPNHVPATHRDAPPDDMGARTDDRCTTDITVRIRRVSLRDTCVRQQGLPAR